MYFVKESSWNIQKSTLIMPSSEELYQIIVDLEQNPPTQEMHSVIEFRKHLFWSLN
jgi:hypothetical protein